MNDYEQTNHDARPVQLFDFNRGSQHWRYARADQNIMFRGEEYVALSGVQESGVAQKASAEENDLSITVPADCEISQLYVSDTPSDRMFITIWIRDLNEPDSVSAGRMYWKGSVGGKGMGDNGGAKMNCQDLAVGFTRKGLRLSWERQCPNTLYDQECTVDPLQYQVTGSLLFAKGDNIGCAILGNFVDGYFSGGYCEWEIAPGIFQRRGIESHLNSGVTVIGGVSTLKEGDVVLFYPGCAHSIIVCDTKFHNKLNYGGVPNLKGDSPFSGNSVFN